ncbi:hypothetical protein KIPB_001465, partial [Kipferlia bialata]|eukprot:g1465.t1
MQRRCLQPHRPECVSFAKTSCKDQYRESNSFFSVGQVKGQDRALSFQLRFPPCVMQRNHKHHAPPPDPRTASALPSLPKLLPTSMGTQARNVQVPSARVGLPRGTTVSRRASVSSTIGTVGVGLKRGVAADGRPLHPRQPRGLTRGRLLGAINHDARKGAKVLWELTRKIEMKMRRLSSTLSVDSKA